jgi:hypothetical protein
MVQVEALVKMYIERENALDWAFVRRVPSTYTWKIVDYLRALHPRGRSNLCQAFAANALYLVDATRDPALHAARSGDPEFKALLSALLQTTAWEYANVRMLRAILGDQLGKRPSPEFANTPVEVLQRAQSIRPTNAREIRKVVKKAFGEHYGARPSNRLGDWQYAGSHRGRPFVVTIDYGGRDQLRYDVEYEDARTGLHPRRRATSVSSGRASGTGTH